MEKINFNKGQYYAYGYRYDNLVEVLEEMKTKIEFLESHNKNYTKEQYYKICDIYNFIKCLELMGE